MDPKEVKKPEENKDQPGFTQSPEPAVSADLAPVRRTARIDGAATPAVLGDGGAVAGHRANRLGWLGQLQLRRCGLHRLSDVPRAMAAACGLRQWLSPDPAHRPELPRRATGQRRPHRDSPDTPDRRVVGDPGVTWPRLATESRWHDATRRVGADRPRGANHPGHQQRAVAPAATDCRRP